MIVKLLLQEVGRAIFRIKKKRVTVKSGGKKRGVYGYKIPMWFFDVKKTNYKKTNF